MSRNALYDIDGDDLGVLRPSDLAPQPTIVLVGICYDCRKRHEYRCTPERFPHAMSEWEVKHRGHRIEFRSPKRLIPAKIDTRLFEEENRAPWWLEEFAPNVDIKIAYVASAAYAIDLSSLASSSSFTAGREGTAILNTSNLYLDFMSAGKITVGTTPTTLKSIRVYAYGSVNDTPVYPDVLDGTDSAETITNAEVLATMPLLAEMPVVSTTSNIEYWMFPKSIAGAFGGLVPKNHGLFVAHDTVAALNSTAGNHVLSYTGIYATG